MKQPKEFPVTIKHGNSSLKIYRGENKGYAEYRLVYYVEKKRKFESFGEYGDAVRRAGEINTSIATGDLAAVSLKGEHRLEYLRAVQLLGPSGTALDLACERYVAALASLEGIPLATAVSAPVLTFAFYRAAAKLGLPRRSVYTERQNQARSCFRSSPL